MITVLAAVLVFAHTEKIELIIDTDMALDDVRAVAAEKIETPDKNKKNLYVVDTTDRVFERLLDDWKKEYNVSVHRHVDYAYMK